VSLLLCSRVLWQGVWVTRCFSSSRWSATSDSYRRMSVEGHYSKIASSSEDPAATNTFGGRTDSEPSGRSVSYYAPELHKVPGSKQESVDGKLHDSKEEVHGEHSHDHEHEDFGTHAQDYHNPHHIYPQGSFYPPGAGYHSEQIPAYGSHNGIVPSYSPVYGIPHFPNYGQRAPGFTSLPGFAGHSASPYGGRYARGAYGAAAYRGGHGITLRRGYEYGNFPRARGYGYPAFPSYGYGAATLLGGYGYSSHGLLGYSAAGFRSGYPSFAHGRRLPGYGFGRPKYGFYGGSAARYDRRY